MTIFLLVQPRAKSDHIATFIASRGGTRGLSRQSISRRTKELKYSRKRASLEAFQAYTPINIMRRELFFTSPPPIGIHGTPLSQAIDIDEAGFTLESCESKYGKSLTCHRVRDTGHYKKGQKRLNLILAVEPRNPLLPPEIYGSIQNPHKWWVMTSETVNQYIFSNFLETLLSDIEQNPVAGDHDRVILWDNLSAHHTGIVTATVELRASRPQFKFTIVPRPPYQPKHAPVEYIFCEISSRLSTMVQPNWTILDLRVAIDECLVAVGRNCKLNRTFRHALSR